MKKMFLFAAAAMVSLSSCVQSETVYTGQVQEMGFKSAVTRGIIQSNDDMIYPIAVTAQLKDKAATTYENYFTNAQFVYDEGSSLWKGEPARYWPTSGDIDFLAFCPYPALAVITSNYDTNGAFETMVISGIDNSIKDQHDILFSDLLSVEAPQTSAQPLLFHHATAQLNLTFKKTDSAAAVIVNSVKIHNVGVSGTLTVTPVRGGSSTAVWTPDTPKLRYFLDADATGIEDGTLDAELTSSSTYSPVPMLVLPGTQTQIEIAYTVDGHDQVYIHDLSTTGETWNMGYKYTYNYTINVNEIIFDCTVDEWDTIDGGNITI